MPEPRSIARGLLFVLTIALFGAGIYLSLSKDPIGAATNYGFGILALVFYFLPDFESFKGFGLEAKLQKKIEEADTIIHQLRNLANPIAELLIIFTARSGRMMAPVSKSEQYRLLEAMDSALLEIGVDNKKIEDAKKIWYQFTALDMGLRITQKIYQVLHEKKINLSMEMQQLPISSGLMNPATPDALNSLRNQITEISQQESDVLAIHQIREDYDNVPTDIIRFISNCRGLDENEKTKLKDDLIEEIEDLNYFITNKRFRSIERWLANE